jgi:hypothetical protein
MFWTFDEYTDVEKADVVRQYAEIVMDAIRNPCKPRPEGEVVLGEMARQWASFFLILPPSHTSTTHPV